MGQKEILEKGNFSKDTKKDLKNYYAHVYKCNEYNKYYGDDEIESESYLCPICDEIKSN